MFVVKTNLFGDETYFGAYQSLHKADSALPAIQTMFPELDDFEVIALEYASSPRVAYTEGVRETGDAWIVRADLAGAPKYFGTYRTKEAALVQVRAVHPEAADLRAHLLFHP